MVQGVESVKGFKSLIGFMIQELNRFMDHFSSSVEKPFHVLLKSWGAIILNFQWDALENACLRVYVSMMDDYGQCPMLIEHIAWLLLFGK